MRRRFFIITLAAAACAPTAGKRDEPASGAGTPSLPPGTRLLAMAHWNAPVARWNQWLAVYEDGLLELRWFEAAERKDDPFALALRVRTMKVSLNELGTLRASLAADAFKTSDSRYDDPGVHDGGVMTIADMETHYRRVVIVRRPAGLPGPVADAQAALNRLAERAKEAGVDGFAAGPTRIELIYTFNRGDEYRHLTVFESGLIELRTVYTSNDTANGTEESPTPHAVTRQADPRDLDALRATLAALPALPVSKPSADTLFVGSAEREIPVPTEPSADLLAVLGAIEALENALESG